MSDFAEHTHRALPALPPGLTAADCIAWAQGTLDGPRAEALELAAAAEPRLMALLEGLSVPVPVQPVPVLFAQRMRLLAGSAARPRVAGWLAAAALILILAAIPASLEIARAMERAGVRTSPAVASVTTPGVGSTPVPDLSEADFAVAFGAPMPDRLSDGIQRDAQVLAGILPALGLTREAGEGRSMAERLYGIAPMPRFESDEPEPQAPTPLSIRERLMALEAGLNRQ